jgi:hypothetical protein
MARDARTHHPAAPAALEYSLQRQLIDCLSRPGARVRRPWIKCRTRSNFSLVTIAVCDPGSVPLPSGFHRCRPGSTAS